jgi:hypothetical protein
LVLTSDAVGAAAEDEAMTPAPPRRARSLAIGFLTAYGGLMLIFAARFANQADLLVVAARACGALIVAFAGLSASLLLLRRAGSPPHGRAGSGLTSAFAVLWYCVAYGATFWGHINLTASSLIGPVVMAACVGLIAAAVSRHA